MRRRFLATLATLLLPATLCMGTPSHAAGDNRGTPSEKGEKSATLAITSVSTPSTHYDGNVTITATLTNNTNTDIDVTATLSTTYSPFNSRSALLAFSDKTCTASTTECTPSHNDVTTIATNEVHVARGSEHPITFTISPHTAGWERQWGARGIDISVRDDTAEIHLSDRSFLVLTPDEALTPMPTAFDMTLTATRGELIDFYTHNIYPKADETQTQASTTAPKASEKRIEELLAKTNLAHLTVFSEKRYATKAAHAGEIILIADDDADINALIESGANEKAKQYAHTFLDTKAVPVRILHPTTPHAIAEYTRLGASAAVIPSEFCYPDSDVSSARVRLTADNINIETLCSDTAASSFIASAPNAEQARLRALALSAQSYIDTPAQKRSHLISFPTPSVANAVSSEVDLSYINAAVDGLVQAPWVQPTTVSGLLNVPASPDTIELISRDTADDARAAGYRDAAARVAHEKKTLLAPLVEDPQPITELIDTALTPLYSQQWDVQTHELHTAATSFEAQTQDFTPVTIAPISTINVIAEATELPVHITNNLNVPITTNVQLQSTSEANLRAQKGVIVTLDPAMTSTVNIPVEARGKANLNATITLHNSRGEQIAQPYSFHVRVRAQWENNTTIVVGIVFFILLILGVARSVRRGRRSQPVTMVEYSLARKSDDDEHRKRRS